MKYEICKSVMTDDKKRKGYNDLLHNTFWISFEEWYQNGAWGEWNQPYTLFDGAKAVANVTVNHMKALYKGTVYNYIQLGGVATDPDYRGKGLSRLLMEEVKKDWENHCDAMFLMSNKSVTEFYPRFGFVEEVQYQYFWVKDAKNKLQKPEVQVRELDLSIEADKALLQRCYKKHNPFSKFQFTDNLGLLEFYYSCGMDASIYYIKEEDAVLLVEKQKNKLRCYDIYYDGEKPMLQLLSVLSDEQTDEVEFLFTPVDPQGLGEKVYSDEDTHLFVLKSKDNIFTNEKLYVPDISHT